MLALSPISMFDRKTIPPSRPAVPGARRRVAVKEGRLAIAKRREASCVPGMSGSLGVKVPCAT
jgi:hypothetical protein